MTALEIIIICLFSIGIITNLASLLTETKGKLKKITFILMAITTITWVMIESQQRQQKELLQEQIKQHMLDQHINKNA